MAGLEWKVSPAEAWPAAAGAYVKAVRAGVHGVALKNAALIENFMKTEAPWQDQTAAARQGLYCEVTPETPAQVVDVIELWFGYGAGFPYLYFLEGYDYRYNFAPTRQGKKFSIITPTLDQWGPKVWAEIRGLFS